MSHRLPPEDKDTLLRFCTMLGLLVGVLLGTWWIVLAVLA